MKRQKYKKMDRQKGSWVKGQGKRWEGTFVGQSQKGGAPKVKLKMKLKRVKMKRVMMKRVKTKRQTDGEDKKG